MTLKKHVESAIDNIQNKTQQTLFGEPELETEQKPKKKSFAGGQTTYWRCKKEHIFRVKFAVHKDRVDKLRCPECGSGVKSKSNKSAYLFYLEKVGRLDAKVARMEKEKKEKKMARDKYGEKVRRYRPEDSED